VRHLLAVSQELHTNGGAGRTILLRYRREEAWATLVSFLGLPADTNWADHILGIVEGKKRIEEIDGIGCQPVLISATTEEMLEWIGDGLRSRVLSFPVRNGPIVWPRFALSASLFPAPSTGELIGSGMPVSGYIPEHILAESNDRSNPHVDELGGPNTLRSLPRLLDN
jgi:hypothetical protein